MAESISHRVDFTHRRHPWKAERPGAAAQSADEHVGFNGRLAAAITRRVGSMGAVYVAMAIQVTWMLLATLRVGPLAADPYPFAFLLFISNVIQLLLMFVIMVGQSVIGAAADKRAIQTFRDVELTLHELDQLKHHLEHQDAALNALLESKESE